MKKLLALALLLPSLAMADDNIRFKKADQQTSFVGVGLGSHSSSIMAKYAVTDEHSVNVMLIENSDDFKQYITTYSYITDTSSAYAGYSTNTWGTDVYRAGGTYTEDVGITSLTYGADVLRISADGYSSNAGMIGVGTLNKLWDGGYAGARVLVGMQGGNNNMDTTGSSFGGTVQQYLTPDFSVSYTLSKDNSYGSSGTGQFISMDADLPNVRVSSYVYTNTQQYVDTSFGIAVSYKY